MCWQSQAECLLSRRGYPVDPLHRDMTWSLRETIHGAFIYLFIYLFIYFWLCWIFVSVRGLSLVAASGGHSSSRCAGLSLSRPLVAEHRLQMCSLSNCGSRAQLLRGMWDLPRPGLEPVCPALADRFSTTAPPGKSSWGFDAADQGLLW